MTTCLLKDITRGGNHEGGDPHNVSLPLFSWRSILCHIPISISSTTLGRVPKFSVEEEERGLTGIRSDSFMHKSLGWHPLYLSRMVFTSELVLSLLSTTHILPSRKAMWLKWTACRACGMEVWQTALSTFTRQVLVCNSVVNQNHTCFQGRPLTYCRQRSRPGGHLGI